MKSLLDWIEDRTGLCGLIHRWASQPVEGPPRWRYGWTTVLLVLLFVEAVTGLGMWAVYSPGKLSSWESTAFIQYQMPLGWFVRGLHHYTAQALVVVMAIILGQIVYDRWYRAPREFAFWSALLVALLLLGLSHTGYQLPGDQRGYSASLVFLNIVGATPVIGTMLQEWIQGGSHYGTLTLTRLFMLHTGLLPMLLVPILAACVYLRARRPQPAQLTQPVTCYWPEQAARDGVLSFMTVLIVVGMTLYYGAELGSPIDPGNAFEAARPEWYFLSLFRFLKFESIQKLGGLLFGAILVPTAIAAFIVAFPFIGRLRFGQPLIVAFLGILGIGVMGLTVLTLSEDARNPAHQVSLEREKWLAERAGFLSVDQGVPPQGALAMLGSDPLTQGPRLFVKHCGSCHGYTPSETSARGLPFASASHPTAADLGEFGNRQWMKQVLVDYEGLFAPLANQTSEAVRDQFLKGDMAGWSKENAEVLKDAANAESVASLVEFLVDQSGRRDLGLLDPKRIAAGREIFTSGKLANGAFSSACADCHSLHVRGETEALSDAGGTGAPTLTGYGGEAWLREFLKTPGGEAFYADHNAMPAFDKLTDAEMKLLLDWMTGNMDLPSGK